jgi:hypothetical protein
MATNDGENEVFNSWLESQDENTRKLVNERFSKLESTVKATRQERNELSTALKDISKKAEHGTDLEKSLTELGDRLTKAERKAIFLEMMIPEGCTKPSVAYSIAIAENLFKDDGTPDMKKIKEVIPEFFPTKSINSHAGSGTHKTDFKVSANEQIRNAARNIKR